MKVFFGGMFGIIISVLIFRFFKIVRLMEIIFKKFRNVFNLILGI